MLQRNEVQWQFSDVGFTQDSMFLENRVADQSSSRYPNDRKVVICL